MQKLVEGYFQLRPLGPTRVAGVSEPVAIFEVTGLGPLRTRLQRSVGRGLTKFVGRQAEIQALDRALELARDGHGQIVAAVAEPGIGKSRLFHEFKTIAQSGCMVLEAFSVSHGKASAFLPLIDLLRNYFEITADDDDRKRREKVTGRLLALDRALEDAVPHIYALLGLADEGYPLEEMDAQMRKRRTLEAIKRVLLRESLKQPLIVIFEDLHWADDETLGFLNLLADSMGTAKLLLMVNYRPEYRQEWGAKTYYTQLRLDPLGKDSAEEMLNALLAAPALAAEGPTLRSEAEDGRVRAQEGIEALKRLIIERTEGNPFFTEEMLLVLFEEGALVRNGGVKLTRSLRQLRIPPTVQAILAARIDRLPADQKNLLQTLAVIGKEFALTLVKRVVQTPDDDLNRLLSKLQLAEFIYEQPAIADIEFTFKHALTQEVAYNSLLIERRRGLHRQTAEAIETVHGAHLEDHYGELAHHYLRSTATRKAIRYLSLAGAQELERSAFSQALQYATAGLELLKTLPEESEEAGHELDLTFTLITASRFSRGPLEETWKLAAHYKDLSLKRDNLAHLARALESLVFHEMNRGGRLRGKELAEEAITIAQRLNDPVGEAGARAQLGIIQAGLGDILGARENSEKSVAMAASQPDDSTRLRVARVNSLMTLSGSLWLLGFPDQALQRCRELARFEEVFPQPLRLSAALVALRAGHVDWVREMMETVAVVTEQNPPNARTAVLECFVRGWLLMLDKDFDGGLALIRESIGIARTAGLKAYLISNLPVLAEGCMRAGRADEGLKAVDEALAAAEQFHYRGSEPELIRLKGELLLVRDPAGAQHEAETRFRRAIALANSRSAKSDELRATMSLARLLARQGQRGQAHAMLAQIYGWFTEGFDTTDLKEAKALLDELSA
jgi:tetratricopeptide (TPR) repeat protein